MRARCRGRIEVRFQSGFAAPEVSSAISSRSNSATSASPGSTSSANAFSPTSMRKAALPAPSVALAVERLPTGCICPSAPSRSTSLYTNPGAGCPPPVTSRVPIP